MKCKRVFIFHTEIVEKLKNRIHKTLKRRECIPVNAVVSFFPKMPEEGTNKSPQKRLLQTGRGVPPKQKQGGHR